LFLKMARIKVILSHPQVIFREGIHFVLSGEEDFEVVGEATTHREAFDFIEANPPDILVLGEEDAGDGAAEITRQIKRLYPQAAVILITAKNDSRTLFTSLASGISAIVAPDAAPEAMLQVIRDVARGQVPIVELLAAPALAVAALADFKDLATLNEHLGVTLTQLSRKETDVLNALAAGGGLSAVAAGQNLNEDAIRSYLRTVLQKLVANDRVRTVITEIQKGLPPLIPGILKGQAGPQEYLTRAEFNEFKESLMARLKSLVN
jgi:DNA-binding NarL/FixJ family response regulator